MTLPDGWLRPLKQHTPDLSPLTPLTPNSITAQLHPTNGFLYDMCVRVCVCVTCPNVF